jgi:hypothetical protein
MMHPTKNSFTAALNAAAVLGLCTIPASSVAQTPLGNWLTATPDRPLSPCASSPGTSQGPAFDFNNGTYFSCSMDGPYPFQNKDWYVLRITRFVPASGGAPINLVRVCSPQATHAPSTNNPKGPCHTAQGVGPKGCEVCAVNGVPQ